MTHGKDHQGATGARPAHEVYRVAGEDRQLTRSGRALRWAGTVITGLLGALDGPSLSDVVIRTVDGLVVRRVRVDTVTDFEDVLAECLRDLEQLDAIAFAQEWFAHTDD